MALCDRVVSELKIILLNNLILESSQDGESTYRPKVSVFIRGKFIIVEDYFQILVDEFRLNHDLPNICGSSLSKFSLPTNRDNPVLEEFFLHVPAKHCWAKPPLSLVKEIGGSLSVALASQLPFKR